MFFENLYKSRDDTLDDIDLEEHIEENEVMMLSNDQSDKIEGILTYKEISNTLYKMKSDKSPGISRLTAEFFKVFWKRLCHFILGSINAGFSPGVSLTLYCFCGLFYEAICCMSFRVSFCSCVFQSF